MLITSKYNGFCKTCAKSITAGERVSWIKGVQGVSHAACSDEGRAVAVKVEASKAVDADVEIPCNDGMTYRGFQRAGIAFGLARKGVLIADEMGLGKTVQLLGIVNGDATIQTVLVVCPKSLTLNWLREAQKWLVRPATFARCGAEGWATASFVVASYEEAKKHNAQLALRGFDLVGVDECHLVKNPKAQRTVAVRTLSDRAGRRVYMTGTPIENRPIELWPLLQAVAPEEWDPAGQIKGVDVPAGGGAGFWRFAKRYCNAHNNGYGWDFGGASNLPELREKLRSTCMVRRLKADVLKELPPKTRKIVELPGNGCTKTIAREAALWDRRSDEIDALRVDVELARAEAPDAYQAAVAALTAATNLAFTEMAALRHETALAKVPHAVEYLDGLLAEDPDRKVVVMAHHRDVIDGLVAGLAAYGAVALTGETTLEDRQAAVDRFQNTPECRVFVGSIKAAGVGITLTAAAHVVFVELDWVPGAMLQAEDRCHRIGQTNAVLVEYLVWDGSIDARLAQVLVAKQAVADAGLDLEPAIPARTVRADKPATTVAQKEIVEAAAKLTPADVAAIHSGLRSLAGMCDGARELDGAGFARIDVAIGHSLAARAELTPKQAALGLRLCRKYRGQIGDLGIAA